ncbi:MAG: hypothetical protein JNL18_08730 [Planctomycetaceae bacterium]|nr:hypothetical protein [Planctomycetaceae bacterium]
MSASVSSLIKLLQSETPQRLDAAQQLLELGSEAVPAAVALVEACDGDQETRDIASAALEDLGPPEDDAVGTLTKILSRPTLDAPYWAATLLGRLESVAAPAVKQLIVAAQGHAHAAVRQRSVWALGKIGPPAAPALESLQLLTTDHDPRLASLARDAVASIRQEH